jgi:hypothetical protein
MPADGRFNSAFKGLILSINFHSRAVHLDIIKVLLPLMHRRIALKGLLKCTLKQLRHVSV